MQRHYYAIYNPDGFDRPNIRGTLYRYDTAKQRAEDIDRVNLQTEQEGPLYGRGTVMQEVTRDQARYYYPDAFSPAVEVWRPWTDGDRKFSRPWWRDYEDGAQEFTGCPTRTFPHLI